jgi:DNA-binding NtrC family response regulator
MKILVVDDEPEIVDELRSFLERRGHHVTCADGVEQVRGALGDGGAFDVVITDMRMPSGSGVEIVEACQRLAPPPAVLLMTGQASEADVDNALQAGACAVLWKPLSLRKVMAAIAAAVPSGAAPQAA